MDCEHSKMEISSRQTAFRTGVYISNSGKKIQVRRNPVNIFTNVLNTNTLLKSEPKHVSGFCKLTLSV